VKRRFTALLATVAMTLGLVFAIQAPAQASFAQCNALAVEICGWENVNWGGVHRKFTGTRYVCYTLQGQYFDQKLSLEPPTAGGAASLLRQRLRRQHADHQPQLGQQQPWHRGWGVE
jgi:hypothetical protein